MAIRDAVETNLEIKSYSSEPVDVEIRRSILDAARLAPSGKNRQHWRFILVDGDNLVELAERSPTGAWVANADFAVAVVTDPSLSHAELDAGRAITYMQFAAWEHGVGSRIYTTDQQAVRNHLSIPDDYALSAVVGFGYPDREIVGRKDRKPLDEIAYTDAFGQRLSFEESAE
ncbi:nitroreductase family protein [Natrinema gelatinilyticum]|uniref:nitroreductase family protein n=1 Tax=Natrinema gelatinilyticum TaxID=2961571 RepID=UPI0020C39345|nr:nitroreductase family protein [Natrinema gelatinilyticum]